MLQHVESQDSHFCVWRTAGSRGVNFPQGNNMDFVSLCAQDQLRAAMAAGQAFAHLQEAPITFRPTYKFDRGSLDPLGYDSSEKRRVPAWTDRILFRGGQPARHPVGVFDPSAHAHATACMNL